ncbi:relaxase/mobilization nuclease domain-containing protein [Clostridium sporogenes]|uniref:Relaxase/mobilization nuclease domain-containing protein n=1 Tax=Clostridium sporogenes TaxID=1509 RepID=A0AAE4FMT8_CLOSG|nr:relaxase/mobilization nuclease domain-containing protein [Clostridium sporogenes]MDS1005249.1 relaxase/mobilization nuclease domain-containing protein [Clostridium sporogenes]
MKSNKIGLEWAEKNFKGFEVLISTHKDKGHIHNHFIVNSVSFENREKEREINFRELGISKTTGDKFNAKNGTGEQFVEGVLGSITREIAGIEARAKGKPRENKRDTSPGNREDKRIEDKQRTIEREHRGRTRDFGR